MRSLVLILAVLSASPAWAASPVVRDGGTIQLADATYRLDGIDAPELDQICIDEHADPWTCGIEARDRLAKLVAGRPVHCDDLGPAPTKKRHIGLCTVEGESDEWSWRAVKPLYCYDLHATILHLLGIDHTRLTFRHNGSDRRLTDVHGEVIEAILG